MYRAIIAVVVVIMLGFFGNTYYGLNEMRRDIGAGTKGNETMVVAEVKQPVKITYLGDELVVGYQNDGKVVANETGIRGWIGDSFEAQTDKKNPDSKLEQVYNYSYGEATISGVSEIINKDYDEKTVNSLQTDLKVGANYDDESNEKVRTSIKDSDILILSIGANDISKLFTTAPTGEIIKVEDYTLQLETIITEKRELLDNIREINPEIKIYDIGIYFPFNQLELAEMNSYYPDISSIEKDTSFDDPAKNVYRVRIIDNIQANYDAYVEGSDNYFLNKKGYEVVANEIMKLINKTN